MYRPFLFSTSIGVGPSLRLTRRGPVSTFGAPEGSAATQVTLTASGFAPYYSYSGSLAVSGTVGPMTTVGTTQTFYWSLSGVDPACSSGPDTSKANSCGSESHDLDAALF